jgi:hypothetical protein
MLPFRKTFLSSIQTGRYSPILFDAEVGLMLPFRKNFSVFYTNWKSMDSPCVVINDNLKVALSNICRDLL